MKLSVIYSVLNTSEMINAVVAETMSHSVLGDDVEFFVIDNGSDEPVKISDSKVRVFRNDYNSGNYPIFEEGLRISKGEIIAYLHSDFIIWEDGWDERLYQHFNDQKVGLIGFIGSNEIGADGGRGLGTRSNFQGKEKGQWKGSPAKDHGSQSDKYSRVAVVDGCSMIFRRSALEKIGFREDFGLHHFYDKLMSCQMLEAEYEVGVLGIECDHFSGQTANSDITYRKTIREWAIKKRLAPGGLGMDWDKFVYDYSENYWLSEYRDKKHFIPLSVDVNGNIIRT